MGDVVGAGAVGPRVEVPGVEGAPVGDVAGLREDPGQRGGILETAYALVRPEVVVERAVLLDEDHDVLDAAKALASRRRRRRDRPGDQLMVP
jgi:hypothetical protein